MWYRLANKPIILSNPVVGGFWVGDRFIDYGEQFGVVELRKLLQTAAYNLNTQEKVNSFLSDPNRFETIDNKKIYIRNTKQDKKSLIIPFDFYVNNDKIEKDKVFVLNKLKRLLETYPSNVNTQEKLNFFLSNPDRFKIIDGKKIYRTLKGNIKTIRNQIGDFYIGNRKISKDEVFNVIELKKLLQTNFLNINTQEKFNSFLSNPNKFEIIDGKKIYLRHIPRSLLIPFDFYVDDQEIKKDQAFSIADLSKLLQTTASNLNTQEKLNSFLSDPNRIKTIDRKKIYIRKAVGSNKNLIIPFDFYVDKQKIEKDQVFSLQNLKNLLQTDAFNLNTQEKVNSFLSDPIRFETINGNKIYIRNTMTNKKSLIIPFDFYVNNDKIEKDKVFGVGELMQLLQTNNLKINTQEKLNSFLSDPNRFETINGNKIYLKNKTGRRKNLIIPFDFYVDKQKIEKDQVLGVVELRNLLQTNKLNINTQEKLNSFLSNSEFRINENGNNQFVPYKGSVRERYINKNLNIANEHNIKIKSQKSISILNPGKSIKILKLDFAFMENEDILLAFEINGGQHYGFAAFSSKNRTYDDWQAALKRDVEKINYCHNNNIPLLIFNHMLPDQYFRTTTYNLNKNPHMYDSYVPQSVIVNDEVNDLADTSLEFIRRQIYSHLYPVFNGIISFDDDIPKKSYIKDTLILIAKLLGIYNGGIDKTDYIRAFNRNVDLTENYNTCLDIYNNLYPDYPLNRDEKITYNDLSVKPRIRKPKEIEEDPLEI